MDFEKVITERRSIRKFDENKKVPRETLEKILTHATLAPSSKNRQPWFFIVIQDDQELKNQIADITGQKLKTLQEQFPKVEYFFHNSIEYSMQVVRNAPCCVAVFDTHDIVPDMEIIPESFKQSIGSCIQTMCLAATNAGVGSLWICDMDIAVDEIKALLGITERSWKLAALVSLQMKINIRKPVGNRWQKFVNSDKYC